MRQWIRALVSTTPQNLRPRTTLGQGGIVWKTMVTVTLGLVGSLLVTMTIFAPTKRNIEVLAGVIFLGFVLVAHPFKALLFAIVAMFFPASTIVGSTSTLLIFAVGGLVMMKSKLLGLGSPFVCRRADLAIVGFGLTLVLSLYKQDLSQPEEITRLITGMVSAIVLYYTVIQLTTSSERFFQLVKIMELMAIAMGVLAILQATFPDKQLLPEFFKFSKKVATLEEIRKGHVRSFATFNGYELFAEYCVMSVTMQYFLIRRSKSLNEKLFWIVGCVIMLLALFGTGTRAGLIVLGTGLIYAIATCGIAMPRQSLLKTAFLSMAVFYLALPFIGGYTDMMLRRFSTIGKNDSSVGSREVIMEQALRAIPDSPFLGHGIYTPPDTFRGAVRQHIHSLYVTLAYKLGIPNLMFFCWLLFTLFIISWRHSRDPDIDPGLREFMFGLNIVLVMFMVDELKIEFTRAALSMHVTFLHFALIPALDQVIKKERGMRGFESPASRGLPHG